MEKGNTALDHKTVLEGRNSHNYALNSIDWARIIGIYLVVLGHMQYCGININVKNFIYLFHMPLFFFISGVLHQNSFKKSANSFIGLIILFIIYNIPYYGVLAIKQNGIDNLTANIPTWFFITLGIIKLMCYNVSRKTGITMTVLSVIFIQIIHIMKIDISSYWYIKSVCMALPFFLCGYLVRDFVLRNRNNAFYIVICIAILIFATKLYGRVDVFQGTFKYTYIDYFIVAMCGVFVVFEIAKRLPCIHNRYLWNISRGTAVIVGCHHIFCVKSSIVPWQSPILPYLYSFAIIAILYSIIALAMRKLPILIGKVKAL